MNYQIELLPSGLFVVSTAVGRPLFDGAFRTDIPESTREAVLNMIASAPGMLAALKETLAGENGALNSVHDAILSAVPNE